MNHVAVTLQAGVFVSSLPPYVSAVLQEGFEGLQEDGRVSPTNKSKLLPIALLLFSFLTDLNSLVFNVL